MFSNFKGGLEMLTSPATGSCVLKSVAVAFYRFAVRQLLLHLFRKTDYFGLALAIAGPIQFGMALAMQSVTTGNDLTGAQ